MCECGVPRSVCMDKNRIWLVDHKVGYRCQALMRVQKKQQKTDTEYEKKGGDVFPEARKWTATDVTDKYGEGIPDYDRQDGPG